MRILHPLRSVAQTLRIALALVIGTASGADISSLVQDLESPDSRKRRQAAYELHQLGPDAAAALPALIKALDDDQDQVFFHSVSAIARIGPAAEAAIPALMERLGPVRRRYGEQINLRAAFTLSRIGKAAVDPLIKALDDSDETLCTNAIEALALMPAEVASPSIDSLVALLGDDRERVSQSNVRALSNFGQAVVPPVDKLLQSGTPAQQRDAILTLGLIGQPAAGSGPKIAEAARNGKPGSLIAALDALVRLRHDPVETIEIVVSALRSDDENVSAAAADGALLLAQVQPELDAKPFADAVKNAPEPVQLRFAAVLGRIGNVGAPAAPALVAAAEKSTDDLNRLAFAEALGGIGGAAAPLLLESASRLELAEIVEGTWSVVSLGQIGAPALPTLRQGLKSDSASCRKAAVVALGLLGSDAAPAIDDLFDKLNDPEAEVRGHALIALPRSGVSSDRMLPVLVPLTADASAAVRSQAFRALGSIKDNRERLLPLLFKGINDSDATVQTGALEAAGQFGEDAAATVPAIKAVLDSVSAETAGNRERAAIVALGKIGVPAQSAVSSIASRLSDKRADVRILALASLGSIGDSAKESLPDIRVSLKDREANVRAQALEAIAKIQPDMEQLTATLMLGLNDQDASVRDVAVERLGALGEDARSAAPELFGLLSTVEDPRPVIDALRIIRTRDHELYVAALSSGNPSVRLFACESLGRFGSRAKSALPELKKLQDDKYDFVRRRADQAIERINRRRR